MELAHERAGTGRPLVLIHGIAESGGIWRPLIAPLSQDREVLVVDLRGHGDSPKGDVYDPLSLATDVHDTVAAVGWSDARPLVVGHSLGGIVATAYASAFPTRGVVNIDQPLRLADFKDGLSQLEPMLRGDEASFQQAIDMVMAALMAPLAGDELVRVHELQHADQSVVLGVWGAVFESTAAELDAQVTAITARIAVPYLALHGNDPGSAYSAWLRALIPTATVEVWDGHGHFPHLIDPVRFVERVRAFDTGL